jgi:hypothetical protein
MERNICETSTFSGCKTCGFDVLSEKVITTSISRFLVLSGTQCGKLGLSIVWTGKSQRLLKMTSDLRSIAETPWRVTVCFQALSQDQSHSKLILAFQENLLSFGPPSRRTEFGCVFTL